jgi:hypothetical protein
MLLFAAMIPQGAFSDTALGEVNEYYLRVYSWSATLRLVVTVSNMTSLEIRCPIPWAIHMQNFDQTSGFGACPDPVADSLWADAYWVGALWDPPDTVSGTYELPVTVSGTSMLTFPSWVPENPWWYPDTDPWVRGTTSAPVNSITQAAAMEVFTNNGVGVDRERDLEGIGSWLQGLVYDDSEGLDQSGDAVISRGSGNCNGFSNALDSIASTMGIPAGHMSAISFPGSFHLGCTEVSVLPGIHSNAVAWDGPDQLWILVEPLWSGTATGPGIAALCYHPEASFVEPFFEIRGPNHSADPDILVEDLFHSGVSGSNCAGWRDACGRVACSGLIVGKKYNGMIPTSTQVVVGAGGFELSPPRPNPTRSSVEVHFVLGDPAHVDLTIYDVQGRRVITLARGVRGGGRHHLVWDGRDCRGRVAGAGIYFVNLEVNEESERQKLVVVR